MGGVHGDGTREIEGTMTRASLVAGGYCYGTGCFAAESVGPVGAPVNASYTAASVIRLKASRIVPTAAKNQVRAWGALACVYLGLPAS